MIDDDTYACMKKEKGLLGLKLRLYTRVDKEDGPLFSMGRDKCPFFDKDGLCKLQKDGRMDLVAQVCKQYPRRNVLYGEFTEVTLELSCVYAATLFVQDARRHRFFIREKESIDGQKTCEQAIAGEQGGKKNMLDEKMSLLSPYYAAMNNDSVFLSHLIEDRERLLDFIWNEKEKCNLFHKMAEILLYTFEKQNYYSMDDSNMAMQVTLPLAAEKKQQLAEWGENWERIVYDMKKGRTPLILPIRLLNELIYGHLSESCSKRRNGYLYEKICTYKKYFGKLFEQEADAYFGNQVQRMYENYPKLEVIIQAYFSYLLQQTYCMAYEDYYLIGPIIRAAADVEFALVFLLGAFLDGETISEELIATTIASAEKSIRHSKSMKKEILELFRRK